MKHKINATAFIRVAQIDFSNIFADTENSEKSSIFSSVKQGIDTKDSESMSLSESVPIIASEPFNNDTDFTNFQLGEFGVTQQ